MLRRLDLIAPWRSLDRGFWAENFPLGSRTVIYGHNGSGKSTLSELLLALTEGSSETAVVWEHDDKQRTTVNVGGLSPSPNMAVFTRKWVDANLSAFLDGAGASAIVTLGREAIDAKEEEVRLLGDIKRLLSDANEAERQRKAADSKLSKLTRDIQDQIVSELKEFDYNFFTKSRFSVPKVQEDLRAYTGQFPDGNMHAEALKRLGEGVLDPVAAISGIPVGVAEKLGNLSGILLDTPTRVAIQSLEGNSPAQTWVEHGLNLHEGLNQCLFCDGQVGSGRYAQLARHFDESWLQIRDQAKVLLIAVSQEKQLLIAWPSTLPATTSLAGELQSEYAEAATRVKDEVNDRVVVLGLLETALEAKATNPSATPDPPDWSVLVGAPSITELERAVTQHNDQALRHSEVTDERKQMVLDHLLGSHCEAFRELEQQAESQASRYVSSTSLAAQAEKRLDTLREERFTTKDMADTLTRDLARVYGKDHLSVAVTDDGKSYACRRGDQPGTDLSDGERTTLSLLYFLRKLEDEQVPGGDPSQRIVIIDDPSSSLDREALFATHQWLVDTLRGFGQCIVLTHDFSLLRLFIKSHKNAWGKSIKKVTEGNVDEIRFPKVAFLEMYTATVDGERRSRVGVLPRLLLNTTTEYAYLFSMVMAGIADSEDHERLFLLPNAARRMLEVFASYKAPHRTDFLQALEVLVRTQEGEPYRDVYDFCNRFSHGEGSESIDVLDARAIHSQIRRCMEFLRAVDGEHFERMCSAAYIDPTVLP